MTLSEAKADALKILEEEGGSYWEILKTRFGIDTSDCKEFNSTCDCERIQGVLNCKYMPF